MDKENFDILHKVRKDRLELNLGKELNILTINGHDDYELDNEPVAEKKPIDDFLSAELSENILQFEAKLKAINSYAENDKFKNYIECANCTYGSKGSKKARN